MKAFFELFKGHKAWTILLALCMLGFGGCAVVRGAGDLFFGVEEVAQVDDPSTPDIDESKLPPIPNQKPGDAPSDWLSKILGVLFPSTGAASIVGALRWLWVEGRKRNVEDMFKALVIGVKDAVDAVKDGEVKRLDKDWLYENIQHARDLFANRDLFDKFVDDIKNARDAEKAAAAESEGEVD